MAIRQDTVQRILDAFIIGATVPRHPSIICQDGVLYSYGRHYPLVKRYDMRLRIGNSNESTPTTNQHRAAVRRYFSGRIEQFIELPDCDYRQVHSHYLAIIESLEEQIKKTWNSHTHIHVAVGLLGERVTEYWEVCALLDVSPVIMKTGDEYIRYFLEANPKIKSKLVCRKLRG